MEARLRAAEQDARREMLGWLRPDARALALSRWGCRVLQAALEVAQGAERKQLAAELQSHGVELYESPNGNHVVSKLVDMMAPPALGTLICKLEEQGAGVVARHQYGCRVLERLLEHCPEEQIAGLVSGVVADAAKLCQHPFGNFVIQHLIEYGSPAHRAHVVQQILPQAPRLAMHRTASHVIQRILDHCETESIAVAGALLWAQSPNSLLEVACNRYGSFVIEQLSDLREPTCRACIKERLAAGLADLRCSQFGCRAAEGFGLLAPRSEESPTSPKEGVPLSQQTSEAKPLRPVEPPRGPTEN